MEQYPFIILTHEMINAARASVDIVKVERTIASKIDTLTGILGEYAFAEYYYGDWKKNRVGENKGEVNFKNIEIKTSSFPFRDTLNLLVREDYAKKRKPPFYIQIIIDVNTRYANKIEPNTKAYICGWATSKEVDKAQKRDFGSKFGNRGGYKCYHIMIKDLHKMEKFRAEYERGQDGK